METIRQEVSSHERWANKVNGLLIYSLCIEFHQHSKVATRTLPSSDDNPVVLKAAIKKSSLKKRDVKLAEKEEAVGFKMFAKQKK